MLARLVRLGDRYGLNGCITHSLEDSHTHNKESMIEFYTLIGEDKDGDLVWDGVKGDWFVSRYYLSTFMEVPGGLCLDGGMPSWTLERAQVAAVQETLRQFKAD